MYSASVDDVATRLWIRELQEIGPSAIVTNEISRGIALLAHVISPGFSPVARDYVLIT
ncbi:BQ5605_C007g04875 [Microbotryum silenes-dioicae]|uniref:BQ5605_C007g04875 protein n=1 Tax=Microbotryum silenes-dioicae TaxID=796604 RepID=A0A2X0MCM4_9BASI|nr:BQ5605_C007g04875 [Microbotryum silenes-dioicae]